MKISNPGTPKGVVEGNAPKELGAKKAAKGFVNPVDRDAEYEANLDYLAEILAEQYLTMKKHGGTK